MANECLAVPLTRKYGSLPLLAQKSMISLEFKGQGFTPRWTSGGSDPEKTRNKQSGAKASLGFSAGRRSPETPAKTVRGSSLRRETGWRSPLLEQRQTTRAGQQSAGATKTLNMDNTVVGSAGKRRLHEDVKTRHSEWLNRISAFNERVKAAAKTREGPKEQTNNFDKGRDTKGINARRTQFPKKEDNVKNMVSTNKNSEHYSQAFSLEREVCFQDYRQKCIQWLETLPDNVTQPMSLR